ncbi:hypothetical protein NCCP2140_31550 [Pseudoalteromonas sp. NCCP-2140]|uniref:DUF2787 family protein n=1 Tax=Pseudoalteromonas sp. NCCP-2140 TaxID=2942288 RepID=UPI00203D1F3F|nr:DUF2787 family protein [Pseudoalteromonas sp. NCCP-2140]GKW54102.1 hypothetical protein NCCP2140_31550 [Pseudoalteromonas sp. NCCP-2140]
MNIIKPTYLTVSDDLLAIIRKLVVDIIKPTDKCINLSFQDTDYSYEKGGFHPVFINLEKAEDNWRLITFTDCHAINHEGELRQEIDLNFKTNEVYLLGCGLLKNDAAQSLCELAITNFITYFEMDVYIITVDAN